MCGEESVNAALFSQSKRSKNLIFGHRRNSKFRSYARIYFDRRRHPGAQRFAEPYRKPAVPSDSRSEQRKAKLFLKGAKRNRKPAVPSDSRSDIASP
jgi:hypothetical protein